MSRTATGWIPNKSAPEHPHDADDDDAQGLTAVEQAVLMRSQHTNLADGGPTRGNEQREQWGVQGGTGKPRTEPAWPTVMASLPPWVTIQSFVAACNSFPADTGLGWDGIHPKALTRLPEVLLSQLVLIMLAAGLLGQWPDLVGWVIVVLLPKIRGGRRPIGLLPMLPRIWSRTRRDIAAKWERQNARPYMYGGAGKGAEVAGWK